MSHPTWVRGLKQSHLPVCYNHAQSHPTWVRGLKHVLCVLLHKMVVAPYVGAWIETRYLAFILCNAESHPTWVRGLKQA